MNSIGIVGKIFPRKKLIVMLNYNTKKRCNIKLFFFIILYEIYDLELNDYKPINIMTVFLDHALYLGTRVANEITTMYIKLLDAQNLRTKVTLRSYVSDIS